MTRRAHQQLGLPSFDSKTHLVSLNKRLNKSAQAANEPVQREVVVLKAYMDLRKIEEALVYFKTKKTGTPPSVLETTIASLQRSKELALAESLNTTPEVPPEEWSKRDRGAPESPADFIRRVYGPWIGQLRRADINRLDRPLYLAFAQWVKRHGLDDDLKFEDRSSIVTAELKKRGIVNPTDAYQELSPEQRKDPRAVGEAARLYKAARRRLENTPKT